MFTVLPTATQYLLPTEKITECRFLLSEKEEGENENR